jgi:lysophospholipase L1-like esterase
MKYVFISLAVIVGCTVVYGIVEALIVKYNGTFVAAPDIPRAPRTFGTGPKLTYVVMGDSTSIGQGAEYKDSYAMQTAEHLAQEHTITLHNTGVSGARVQDLLTDQLPKAVALKPDVVLLGIGANDTTHFTSLEQIQDAMQKTIDSLRKANPDVRIVATRSPALDSVSRFPPVSKFILKMRTAQVNKTFDTLIETNHITPAYIAEKTRDAFLADPTLTAVDNFHPNKQGYGLWIPILNSALDTALEKTAT